MSEITIWNALRKGGLSEAAAAAMMGNMYCESLLISNNVENRSPMPDDLYTQIVDTNPDYDFEKDNGLYLGYGLCQWTFYSRKRNLRAFAKSRGVSIGNEEMQCEFCCTELKEDFPQLYAYLLKTTDVYAATDRICREYERPAVNNVTDRFSHANKYYLRFKGEPLETEKPEQQIPEEHFKKKWEYLNGYPKLKKGDKGRAVFMLQSGLADMGYNVGKPDGDFGPQTERGLNFFKFGYGLTENGIADPDVWEILLGG